MTQQRRTQKIQWYSCKNKMHNEMETRGFARPQYLGCQYHILDLILKHVLDHFVNYKSTTPGSDYKFVGRTPL